jgi:hypothetical protein
MPADRPRSRDTGYGSYLCTQGNGGRIVCDLERSGGSKPRGWESHLLSQPPSALTRHRHGRRTKLILQVQERYQTPLEEEKTRAGQGRGQPAGEEPTRRTRFCDRIHRTAASGHDEEGTRAAQTYRKPAQGIDLLKPEPIPAGEGNDDPQRREADVDEKEASQRHSGPDPDVQVAGGSGPNRGIHPSQPSPSLPHKAEPDST